jgi:hypothetical protein
MGPHSRALMHPHLPSGVGTVNVLCNARGKRRWLVLDNLLFAPPAQANLISVLRLIERGAKVEFSSVVTGGISEGIVLLVTVYQWPGALPSLYTATSVGPQDLSWVRRTTL